MLISTPTRTQRFSVVLMIELWERFGFYGMQAVLLLFMVQRLGMPDRDANLLWGAFSAMLYCTPVIGGWLGDRVIGSRRCMIAGATILAVGYLLMSLPSNNTGLVYLAMGAIVAGTGLFKPNAANMVRSIYSGNDSRLDAAFTLYYMSVNVGSTVSILLTPWLKDRFGWHTAFAVCCAGLVAALAGYALLHRRLEGVGSTPDHVPLHRRHGVMVLAGTLAVLLAAMIVLQHPLVARGFVWLAGLGVALFAAVLFARSGRAERPGLLAMYILTLQAMMFFIFYQQQATSLTLFALRNVDANFMVGGTTLFSLSPGQFQALNPIWIMVLSPVLAWGYNRLGRSGRDFSVGVKFLVGYVAIAASCLFWFLGSNDPAHPIVSPWIMVVGYGLISLGELLTNGLGYAMVSRYVPKRMAALMIGAYSVAAGVALYLGGIIANWAAIPHGLTTLDPAASLLIYHGLFGRLLLLALAVVAACAAVLPVVRRLDRTGRAGGVVVMVALLLVGCFARDAFAYGALLRDLDRTEASVLPPVASAVNAVHARTGLGSLQILGAMPFPPVVRHGLDRAPGLAPLFDNPLNGISWFGVALLAQYGLEDGISFRDAEPAAALCPSYRDTGAGYSVGQNSKSIVLIFQDGCR